MSRTPRKEEEESEGREREGPVLEAPPRPSATGPRPAAEVDGQSGPRLSQNDLHDAALLERDARAADEAGDRRRGDALLCARALLAERQGDDAGALRLWRSAFDRDPSLLVAFWGLRRGLHQRGAWEDLQGAIERRIATLIGPESAHSRAELWLDQGRIWEDRLGDDQAAANSYRAGLVDAPGHAGLLLSLLLLGLRSSEAGMTGEALSGLLSAPSELQMPSPLRASLSALLARVERETPSSAKAEGRALHTLRSALDAVGAENSAPLITELGLLARASSDPATRVEILEELVSRLAARKDGVATDEPSAGTSAAVSAVETAGATADLGGELAAALLRERAHLLDQQLANPKAAAASLRSALGHSPGHPIAMAELADLLEAGAEAGARGGEGDGEGGGVADELGALLAEVAPADAPFESVAQRELAVRHLTALASEGRYREALVLWERHRELTELRTERPDLFALDMVLRAGTSDHAGLAASFERLGEALLASAAADARGVAGVAAAAHALVAAGTLLERASGARGATAVGDGAGEPGELEDQRFSAREHAATAAMRLYRRALEIAPGYRAASDAVERRLWAAALDRHGQRSQPQAWEELAHFLERRLAQASTSTASGSGDAEAQGQERAEARAEERAEAPAVQRSERVRLLEDLVAVHRDHLNDPLTARRHQEELIAAIGGRDTRAWVRRHDLELASFAHGHPSTSKLRVAVLRQLADRTDVAAVASALRVEAARLAAGADDLATARELFRLGVPGDLNGAATSGLERLSGRQLGGERSAAGDHGAAAERAQLVRAEMASLSTTSAAETARAGSALPPAESGERLRALRFRLAWHELRAGRPDQALDALRAAIEAGDLVARAWSWDIARRSGDPAAELAALELAAPQGEGAAPLEFSTPADRGEALERAADLPGAQAAFRVAQTTHPSTDAALGLLRVASATGDAETVLEASRHLAAMADETMAPLLAREVALLEHLHRRAGQNGQNRQDGSSAAVARVPATQATPGPEASLDCVLRWAAGVARGAGGGDGAGGAAAGLLAIARALPTGSASDDRHGLLVRAAARSRMGGPELAQTIHDQLAASFQGSAALALGLSDLPIAGRPERRAARIERAERNDGTMAYALHLECALDAEARGEAAAALQSFARALAQDGEGIEALDGLKRLALAAGDRLGAARAGVRLAMVLRSPARAAAEFGMAAQIWEDLGRAEEAAIAYWQALARDPGSQWVYESLRRLLSQQRDGGGLDRLYGHRLAALTERQARVELLLERAAHRLEHLEDAKAAIEDFKRILKLEPEHLVAVRHLATLAMRMEHFPAAVRFLQRLLTREGDEEHAAALRLELAEAYEGARDPARAIEVLRRAASARPRDGAPWQRLTDLLLRSGDWASALATFRSWEAVLAEPTAKAEIWVRIGSLLRDQARDRAGASAAFVTAADLDPLGDGFPELLALASDADGPIERSTRHQALQAGVAALRGALATDPLDAPRLRRLKELQEWSARAASSGRSQGGTAALSGVARDANAGAQVAAQLLALAGEDVALFPSPRGRLGGKLGVTFWSHLRPSLGGGSPASGDPDAVGGMGLVAEIWGVLAAAVGEMYPPPKPKLSPRERERLPPGSEPRLVWVEEAAVAVGLPELEVWLPRRGAGDPSDESVTPLEGEDAALFLGRGVLTGNAAGRFRVGRALGLLRERAVVMERVPPADLEQLIAAAAIVAGGPAPVGFRTEVGVEERARLLAKTMSRRARKALELQASRFGFEPLQARPFQQAVLETADRFGLVLAGDVAAAVRVVCGVPEDDAPGTAAELATQTGTQTAKRIGKNQRAMSLVRFALSDAYLAARRESGMGDGDRG